MNVRIQGIAAYIAILAGAALLALWLYAAWLDIQPTTRPQVWHDKSRHVVCYWIPGEITCLPR